MIRSVKDAGRRDREACRDILAADYVFPAETVCEALFNKGTSYEAVDRKLKERAALSFDDTYLGMLYVLAATNRHAFTFLKKRHLVKSHMHAVTRAAAFLQGMAMREAYENLSVEEIAGLVAGANLDLIVKLQGEGPPIFEMCGMGGDIGMHINGVRHKTINATTLTSIMLAAYGRPCIKHGSGKNTSKVGSTDVIVELGIRTKFEGAADLESHFRKEGFAYIDAAIAKTLHDVSSLMNVETINHLVGPLTLPVDPGYRVNKILGVNNKVDPSTCAKVFVFLRERGLVAFNSAAVVCGFPQPGEGVDPDAFTYRDSVLDELSPHGSAVAFVAEGVDVGTYRIGLEDFGISTMPCVWVENCEHAIMEANIQALQGRGHQEYLAMNLALALFVDTIKAEDFPIVDASSGMRKFPREKLRECYGRALDFVLSGEVRKMVGW